MPEPRSNPKSKPRDSTSMLEQLELEISSQQVGGQSRGAPRIHFDADLKIIESDPAAASVLGISGKSPSALYDCRRLNRAQLSKLSNAVEALFESELEGDERALRFDISNGVSVRAYCLSLGKTESGEGTAIVACKVESIQPSDGCHRDPPFRPTDTGLEFWTMDTAEGAFRVVSSNDEKGSIESIELTEWIEKIIEQDRARFRDSLNRLIGGDASSMRVVYRMRNPDGELRYVSTIARRSGLAENGTPSSTIIGLHRDETESTNVIDDLRLFSFLAEKAQIAIVVTDADGRINWCNKAFSDVTGYELDEVFGQSPHAVLLGPLSDESTIAHVDERIRRGKAFFAEHVQYKKNGVPYWVRVDGSPLVDESGAVTRFIFFQTDITETRKTQNAILRNEIKYRSLFDNSSDALLLLSPMDGVIIEANRAAMKLLDAERLVGQRLEEIFPGKPMFAVEHLNEIVENEESARRESGEFVTLSGERRPVEISVNRTPIGEAIALFVTLRDVSEKRLLEEQLRHAQRMEAVGRLSGGIAHDFNNLLAGLRGFSELLCNSRDLSKKDHVYAHEILKITDRASKLTSRLLSFSRGKSDKPVVASLNEIIGNLTAMLSRILKKNIHFTSQLDPKLCNVRIDPTQIEQVVMNLVVNGQEAISSQEGVVTLSTSLVELLGNEIFITGKPKAGRYARVSVRDNGQGMPKTVVEKIFEPFFTTKKGAGTGLGLSIVYGIIQSNDGHLMVDSVEGRGTEFSFYFPEVLEKVEVEESTDHTAKMPSAPTGSGECPTILVAEDQDQVREILELGLGQSGYNLLVAGDGAAAIRFASEHRGRIDLLLTDSIMPKASGCKVVREVKRLYPDAKVVMMSGLPQQESEECRDLKIDAYVDKPFSIRKLLELIESLLGVRN